MFEPFCTCIAPSDWIGKMCQKCENCCLFFLWADEHLVLECFLTVQIFEWKIEWFNNWMVLDQSDGATVRPKSLPKCVFDLKLWFWIFPIFFRPSSYPANGWSWHKKKMYNHVEFWWENGVGSSGQFEEDLAAGIPLERREVLQSPWIPKNDLNTC